MSKNNYNKYSKKTKEEAIEQPVVEEVVSEDVVREEVTEQPAVEAFESMSEPVEKEVPASIGVVVDCSKLNVRRRPSINAEIECEIVKGTEVEVNEAESTNEFYKIYTAAGIEGYCMKQFIKIK